MDTKGANGKPRVGIDQHLNQAQMIEGISLADIRQLHLYQMKSMTQMMSGSARVERHLIWMKALMVSLVCLDLLWRAAIAFWGTVR